MSMICGICLSEEEAATAPAPCGFPHARFHEACLAEWARLHTNRCPHCNGTDAVGTLRRVLSGWLASTEADTWKRGPVFVRVQGGMLRGAEETRVVRALLRCLFETVGNTARIERRSVRTLRVVSAARVDKNNNNNDRVIEVTLRRTAFLAPGGGGNGVLVGCDGFNLTAVQRRVCSRRRRV
jgi:hypothetical protein